MKANTPKDRAVGTIMGTFIGDALGVGPHWYYDREQLEKDYGDWIDNYSSPKAVRYHAGLTAGENSQTGQVAGFLLEAVDADSAEISFYDAVLQPRWSYEAARDEAIQINPPWAACRLFGLACPLEFMLPAAYYFSSRFENDFDLPVLSAINGGGNNMARASLTGALAGAQVGIRGFRNVSFPVWQAISFCWRWPSGWQTMVGSESYSI
jgi:ADP-ribosylglycohydrolase